MEQLIREVQVIEFGKVAVKEVPLLNRALLGNELIIAVQYAPFSFPDMYTIQGKEIFHKDPPFRFGIEGFGVVETVGEDLAKNLVGRHCLFVSFNGVYGSKIVLPHKEVYILDEDINLDFAKENFAANPLTAYAFLQMAKDKKAQAIIQTAASSNVGKWITTLAKQAGIKSIAIIRNEKHAKELTELGADIVLNSTGENYTEKLKKAIDELKPTMYFDALGGDKPAAIFAQLPPHSVLVCYGMIEGNELVGLTFTSLVGGKSVISYAFPVDTLYQISQPDLEKILNNMFRQKPRVHEPLQLVELEQAPNLQEIWKTRHARLVLKF